MSIPSVGTGAFQKPVPAAMRASAPPQFSGGLQDGVKLAKEYAKDCGGLETMLHRQDNAVSRAVLKVWQMVSVPIYAGVGFVKGLFGKA